MTNLGSPIPPLETAGLALDSAGNVWRYLGTYGIEKLVSGPIIKAPATGVPEAPKDGLTYGRNDGAWTPISGVYLPLTGVVLPTTLPETPGVLWNNGGVLCIS